MKLTLAYLTMRPGGIDLLGSSLEQQEDKDYELVIVDDLPGRPERESVKDYLDQIKVPLHWHGPSKPHSYRGTRMGLCNAMNTAYCRSTGSHIVFLHDFINLPPYSVSRWKEKFTGVKNKRTLIHGVAHMTAAPLPQPGDVRTFGEGEVTLTLKWDWIPEEFELFYLGVPALFMEEINGVDERADHCGMFILNSVLHQAKALGYEIRIDRSLDQLMLDHRAWDSGGWDDADSQWRIVGHHTTLPSEPKWRVPSPNPFKIYELRGKL